MSVLSRMTFQWLLQQTEWWLPRDGQPVRLTDMTDTHRWHLLGWLDDHHGAADTVLGQALRDSLPKDGPQFRDLLDRAEHHSTCPTNRDLRADCLGLACAEANWAAVDDGRYDPASGRGC